jgi:hypothetical protein
MVDFGRLFALFLLEPIGYEIASNEGHATTEV